MTRPDRHFPTDDELDQWMSATFVQVGDIPSHLADQANAATRETTTRVESAAPNLIAKGEVQWAYIDHSHKPDPESVRAAARMILVAINAGVQSMCDHTDMQLIRPLMLLCDPPLIACGECIRNGKTDILKVAESIGHLWDHQCDRCGARAEWLSACTCTLGPLTIAGHICGSCAEQDQKLVERLTDERLGVEVVGAPPNRAARRQKRRNP